MRILIYGINYSPELVGIGKYTSEMCEWLAAQGNKVSVITAMPYYPTWQVFDSFKGRFWFTEILNGVTIHRCPLYVPKQVSGTKRIVHELSFVASSVVFWISALFRKYDVIICVAPPLQLGLAGVIYSLFHRTLFIYHIQDLQLDAARQLGLIKNGLLFKIVARIEKLILGKSDYASTISEGMKEKICLKGLPTEKVIDLRNWIDTELFVPEPQDQKLRESFQIEEGARIILYSGNLGEKQGIDLILDVAEPLMKHKIVFLIIGEGAYKSKLEREIVSRNLHNVLLHPLQPYNLLCKVLNLADLHLVLQKKAAADLVLPSKLTAILSVGGCALVTAEEGTSLYEIAVDNRMAIIVEPESPSALENAIVTALSSDLSEYKKNARRYAVHNLDRQSVMRGFQEFLISAVERRKGQRIPSK